MSLNIEWHGYHGYTVRPGSKVTGEVHFSSTKDEAISAVTIAFTGRCKVKIREHLHYTTRTFRSRGYYFYKTLQLFHGGSYTHKAGDFVWPFEFHIPDFAEQKVVGPAPQRPKRQLDHTGIMKIVDDQSSRDFFPMTAPWRGSNDLRPHPLPDTFATTSSKWPIDLEAKVEYVLLAKLERPSKGSLLFKAKDLESVVDLTLKAPPDHQARGLLKKYRTLDETVSISPSLNRASSAQGFNWANVKPKEPGQRSEPKDERGITFSVHYPTAVCASSTLPVFILAHTQQDADNTVKAIITDLNVSIVGETSVRDDSQAATEHKASKIEREQLCFKRDLQSFGLELRYSPHAKRLQGKLELEDLIHVSALAPSFSTFNIARRYTLEYEIKIKVLGVTTTPVVLKQVNLPIIVLPTGSDVKTQDWSQVLVPPPPPPIDAPEKAALPLSKEEEARAEALAAPPPIEAEEALPAYEP